MIISCTLTVNCSVNFTNSKNKQTNSLSVQVLGPESWPQLNRPHHHVQPTPQQIPSNRMQDALLSRATASLSSPVLGPTISVPVNVGAPIRPSQEQASYAEVRFCEQLASVLCCVVFFRGIAWHVNLFC